MVENEVQTLALLEILDTTFSEEEKAAMLIGILQDKYEGNEKKIVMFLELFREMFDKDNAE